MQLQSPTTTASATGQPVKTYTTYASVRGYAKTVRGLQYYAQEQAVNETQIELHIWYRADLEADHRILMDGQEFELVGPPENVNMMNRELLLRIRRIS